MVKAEKWDAPKGYGEKQQVSKWVTMPELMFMYRAATFFGRAHDSDLLMGMKTVEELEDIHSAPALTPDKDGVYSAGFEPKTPDLYDVTKESPDKEPEAEPIKVDLTGDEIAEKAGTILDNATVPTENRKFYDAETDTVKSIDLPKIKDPAAWLDMQSWRNLRSPGVKRFAAVNRDTFRFAGADIQKRFREKWELCAELKDEPFPFKSDGSWGFSEETEKF
jgi:hypothetical protein